MALEGNPKASSRELLHRPGERDFLLEVLADLEDLPADLASRLEALIDLADGRADAIRDLLEEVAGD